MIQPVISVVLAVYNGGAYLRRSVESVLEQDLAAYELLILDDCSTDGGFEWLQGLTDSRIQLFRNETNRGLFYNLNFLINKSNSPLIKLWSQDDIMYPHCLSSFVDFHKRHPGIGFSYSGRDMIDKNGKIKENNSIDNTPEIISTELHARIAYYTGSIAGNIANTCISKTALDKVGSFKEDMKISADFDMWVRLAEHFDTGFIHLKLIQLRDHEGQLSRNEKYYINHVKEDLLVYRYLDSYVTERQKAEGKIIVRSHKLVFYYTLMVKAFFKADFKTTLAYMRQLASIDNLFLLTVAFVKAKISKPAKPTFLTQFDQAVEAYE
ncbi:MAG: glycosyltransferase [Sphingobacteriales bacterium]|nr:MAG: glycosyltransferase [Sphingobacteriales bacterium]